ncbi:MAG: beta-ketoacyl-ACP synthase III [Gammaproteobacteria bacterium]|nr:beta-ketoacyl-ACP synthase III [Gammaproteobacteria bacterium]
MKTARVTGTGSYLPERIMPNAELEATLDTTDEWIVARTGIRQRHVAAADEMTSDLAEQAARRAIQAAGIQPSDLDLIVVATTTPDLVFPSVACLLQNRLGIRTGCPAFDVQAVCAGFVYAMDVVHRYFQTGGCTRALVVGAETFTRILDWTDRNTCVLFGDGAGAVVLEAADEPGIISTHLHADGRYHELLNVSSGVSSNYSQVVRGEAYTQMQGSEVFKWAVKALGDIVDETLDHNGMQKSDVDWLVPHQANIRIIAATAKKLQMSMDQVIVTVDRHGNTSAASIPMAFDEGVRDGRIKRGDTIIMEGFGGGFAWGSALLRY